MGSGIKWLFRVSLIFDNTHISAYFWYIFKRSGPLRESNLFMPLESCCECVCVCDCRLFGVAGYCRSRHWSRRTNCPRAAAAQYSRHALSRTQGPTEDISLLPNTSELLPSYSLEPREHFFEKQAFFLIKTLPSLPTLKTAYQKVERVVFSTNTAKKMAPGVNMHFIFFS